MKSTFLALILVLSLPLHGSVFSDGTLQSQRAEAEDGDSIFDQETRDFWELSSYGNAVGRSCFRTPGFSGQRISYYESQAMLSYNHFFNPRNAISLGGTYGNNGIHWRQSPDFTEDTFQTASVTLGGYSKEYERWLWRANFTARFSLNEKIPTYVLYTSALWGRYDLTCRFGTHVGYFFETGLRKDKVWPILGFDYEVTEFFKLYAVYPFEASMRYDFCQPWAMELSSRFFRYRDRLAPNEPNSQGLIEYRNTGAELRLVYDQFPMIKANIHLGYAFGGDLRVSNRKDQNPIHYKFNGATYLGGDLNIKF